MMQCFCCFQNPFHQDLPLCKKCWADFVSNIRPRHLVQADEGITPHASALDYQKSAARLVKLTKSQPRGLIHPRVGRILSGLATHWQSELSQLEIDLITFVPGHPLRCLFQFNLAEFFALTLSRTIEIPLQKLIVRKLLDSGTLRKTQKSKSLRERHELLDSHSFFTERSSERNEKVLLVDDVKASGASLLCCRKLLHEHGFTVTGTFTLAEAPSPEGLDIKCLKH